MAVPQINLSQGPAVSQEPETLGFDLSSGFKWVYPENYPKRDYQFSIVQTALYNNTLVCLPTGLGKTFIAAVVMYNFWRWYPRGRVVFLAPTKPLVAQQIHACHDIMGIPSDETIELTGAINQKKRKEAWTKKRVIFATPQTFQKDLQNDCVPFELVKCVVIDEAHKALGKHSYCEIVRMLNEKNKFFRVLALSATPGSKIDHVKEVIQNLLISELELRDDTSPDIIPYTNSRSMEQIIVHLDDELNSYKERYLGIIDPHVRILIKSQILTGSTANISKGRIFMLMKQYESRPQKANNHGTIMKTLNILLTMYHAYELLIKHGLRAFYHFYANHSDKFWYNSEADLQLMLENIKVRIGAFPVVKSLDDSMSADIPDDLVFGHPKFDKLRQLLMDHFKSYSVQNKSTRAIVFVEYRDIVNEVYVLLLQNRPLIRPQMFVGQAGQKQKEQLAAVQDFRNNKVNVLISTSVGEEGLDVGEVDLIVCFDISSSTPTRLVQRMGRTGRKRSGRVVILLTEGKEVQTLNQAMSKKESLNNKVLQSSGISSSLYQSSPRMVPPIFNPECMSMFIKALPKTPKDKVKAKAKATKAANKAVEDAEKKEKKPRKKAKKDDVPTDNNDEVQVVASTSRIKSPKPKSTGSTQPSMMKFLTSARPQQQQKSKLFTSYDYENDSGVILEEFQNPYGNRVNTPENPYAIIRPNEVKLLTSDSHSLEFLTLCAMKKSEPAQEEYLKIDTTWIPQRSPVDIFSDFSVPFFDNLDWVKDLALCKEPTSDYKSDGEDFQTEEMSRDLEDFHMDTTSNSKYTNDTNTAGQSHVEFMEVESFDCYPKESKYTSQLAGKTSPFKNDMDVELLKDFSRELKYTSQLEKKSSPAKAIDEVIPDEFYDDFFTPNSKSNSDQAKPSTSRSSSVFTSPCKPAQVENDFVDLLDDFTESEPETTGSPPMVTTGDTNIFDDLLNEDDSTDDDLFDNTNVQQQNVTVVEAKNKDETIVNSLKASTSSKRSASVSPCRIAKKAKIEDSSDGDSSVCVAGTPQKVRLNHSFNETLKPVPEVNDYPDSDQDMFDDLDFETQFSFEKAAKQSPILAKRPVIPPISVVKDIEIICLDQETVRDEKKNHHDALDDLSILNCTNFAESTTIGRATPQALEIKIPDERAASSKSSISQAFDLDFDWDDESDFVIDKKKTEKEKVSGFFPQRSSQKPSRSQEPAATSSSGWISIERVKSQPRNPLQLKRSQSSLAAAGRRPKYSGLSQTSPSKSIRDFFPSTSSLQSSPSKVKVKKSVAAKKSSQSSPSKSIKDFFQAISPSKSNNKDDDEPKKNPPGGKASRHQVLSVTTPTKHRPKLSLRCKLNDNPRKDKDGFALPSAKVSSNCDEERGKHESKEEDDAREFGLAGGTCGTSYSRGNKENRLPEQRWKRIQQRGRRKDNGISPRFRRYHSENELRSKRVRKPKARKRIANHFIEEEAEQSSDVDTSEGSSGDEDHDLSNFVSYTQQAPDEHDMTAHYLQSVNRSPVRAGAFMFKSVRNHVANSEVFSQPMSQVDESYMHDSFCVDEATQRHESDEAHSDDSLMEDIAAALEESRRTRTRQKKESKFKCLREARKKRNFKRLRSRSSSSSDSDVGVSSSGNNNRRKNDSSSDDETEALRRQVMEESMMFKK